MYLYYVYKINTRNNLENKLTILNDHWTELLELQDNIERLNEVIEKYNSSVKGYSQYYTSFPNFIIAKSYGYKRKEYFKIQFGIENIDFKRAKKELKEWQIKIEM